MQMIYPLTPSSDAILPLPMAVLMSLAFMVHANVWGTVSEFISASAYEF